MLNGNIPCEGVLLVQGTGSGKSSVPQTVAVVDGGVTIVIENTLALGSDQRSKIANANDYDGGKVIGIQLDELKNPQVQKTFADSLKTYMTVNSTISILLFSSPETIAQPIWLDLIKDLIGKQIVKLICIDEVHLFVEFGVTFRPSFCLLKEKLFSMILTNTSNDAITSSSTIKTTSLKVPMLCMTATFNHNLLTLLQQMIGIYFHANNLFWNGPLLFRKRNIKICIKYSKQTFRFVKDCLSNIIKPHIHSKAIICSNSATSLQQLQLRLDDWLDTVDDFKGDTVLVIGDQETELKLAYTVAFTSKLSDRNILDDTVFYPRFMLGTSGCIGAGLDCDDVHLVCRIGLSTSILNLIQETGRCGRKSREEDDVQQEYAQDTMTIIFTLSDFVYLNQRLFIIDTDESNNEIDETNIEDNDNASILSMNEQRKMQMMEIQKVSQLFCLNIGCWHVIFENECANPYHTLNPSLNIHNNEQYEPCGNMCPQCDGSKDYIIRKVLRNGLCGFLVYAFMVKNDGPVTPENLAKLLFNYPQVGKVVYNRMKSLVAESISIVQMTIMQLLAANIISLEIEEGIKPVAYCKMSIDVDISTPHYLIDKYWTYINTFDSIN